jgi:hypothetical protein
MEDTITLTTKEYRELFAKAYAFDQLQRIHENPYGLSVERQKEVASFFFDCVKKCTAEKEGAD